MTIKHQRQPVDWAALVLALLEQLLLTQTELAERCKVAQQSVSAWKSGTRRPGRFAQRQLVQLAREAGMGEGLPGYRPVDRAQVSPKRLN